MVRQGRFVYFALSLYEGFYKRCHSCVFQGFALRYYILPRWGRSELSKPVFTNEFANSILKSGANENQYLP